MSKKVLILSCSPRKKGNSDTLCEQFMKGAKDAGHNVEKIFVASKKIKYCTGCGVCNKTHKCVISDDMEEILPKMIDADVIVMSTPVYFYSMDAQMKTLIDRTVPRYSEMKIKITSGKTVVMATLNETNISKDFWRRLPLTLKMRKHQNREYYTDIKLVNTEKTQNGYNVGDIAYWRPGNSIVLFYDKGYTGDLIIMGNITSGLDKLFSMGEEFIAEIDRLN